MYISHKVIGHNIRQERIKAGLTQEAAAELFGLSTLHYGRIERGTHAPSLEQLALIAELLNTSFETPLSGSTNHLWTSTAAPKKSIGNTIDFLALGCSESAQCLMLDICQLIAKHDKFTI